MRRGYVTRLLRFKTASCSRSSQEGFTIIESLIALMVAGILLAAVAPVMTIAVATRVQSRRVELATQAARAYIDGVRTGQIAAPSSTGSNQLNEYAAPTATGSLNCSANTYCTTPTGLYCVDFDGGGCTTNSMVDMVVQAFRHNTVTGATASDGYALGVRVYRADAFALSATLGKSSKQATFTGKPGILATERGIPLVEMTTEVNDTVPTYSDLCARLSGCTDN